MIDWLDQ